MKPLMKLAACAAALAALAACGDDRGSDGLSADERERLNAAAERLDNGADVVDASPDSLVANDEWSAAEAGEAGAAENAAQANGQ